MNIKENSCYNTNTKFIQIKLNVIEYLKDLYIIRITATTLFVKFSCLFLSECSEQNPFWRQQNLSEIVFILNISYIFYRYQYTYMYIYNIYNIYMII